MIFGDNMRKTAHTDNEIALFPPKLTGFIKETATFILLADRVPVYARSLSQSMFRAIPKKRGVCPVQQTFSHTSDNIPSQNKAFRRSLLRRGCCSVSKASPAFCGTGGF